MFKVNLNACWCNCMIYVWNYHRYDACSDSCAAGLVITLQHSAALCCIPFTSINIIAPAMQLHYIETFNSYLNTSNFRDSSSNINSLDYSRMILWNFLIFDMYFCIALPELSNPGEVFDPDVRIMKYVPGLSFSSPASQYRYHSSYCVKH